LVCSAIPPNEVLGFFSIKSDAVIGFVVPTASPLMVRFESCNGASKNKKFLSESIFSVLLTRAALFYFFKFLFVVSKVTISNSLFFLLFYYIDALSHCFFFYDVIHRPYTLESYIFLILLPSIYHPSFYPHPFSFASQPKIWFLL
jgi:hypothetical protein